MAFVQLMEFTTSDPQGVTQLLDEWTDDAKYVERTVMTKHHDDPNRYCLFVFFPSYEAAMENSQRPETEGYAQQLRERSDGDITYFDLDIVEDKQL